MTDFIHQIIVDTLKTSVPGISETMRGAIATSVMIKLRAKMPASVMPRDVAAELKAALDAHLANPSSENEGALRNGLWTCREALVGDAHVPSTERRGGA